jgi:hypothetical protein
MDRICKNCEYYFSIGLDCGYCDRPSSCDMPIGGEPEGGGPRQETDSCGGFKQKQDT